jgi:NAD(P) transhydrogenase
MNRSLTNVLFGGIAPVDNSEYKIEGSITKTNIEETADALATAESVIIVVGYGMAVAKAQYAISDITRMLKQRGINVRFAIHPVAGRMPGQCNVLLAEASVPYDSMLHFLLVLGHADANNSQSFLKWTRSTMISMKQTSLL